MTLTIRPARPEDLQMLVAMMRALAEHHGEALPASPEALRRLYFNPGAAARALLAADPSGVIGFAALTPAVRLVEGERGLEVALLYVQADRRGQGVGRALMEAAAELARDEGRQYLVVGAQLSNRQAQAAYRAMGLEDVASTSQRFYRRLAG